MNIKHVALIVVVAALVSVIATTVAFTFLQLPTKNGNTTLSTTSPTSSLPSTSSQVQSLTPDEIATLKADSLEMEIKDLVIETNGISFIRFDSNLWSTSVIAQNTNQFANYTSVSETTVLGYIQNYLIKYGTAAYSPNLSISRVGNTFYFTVNSSDYPQDDISYYCAP